MMEFLDTLFSYDYFGPILFAIIAVLIVIFFIVLFFGKKDEKERKLEETRRLEELANVNAFKDESKISEVEVQKVEMPVIESNVVDEEASSLETVFVPVEITKEEESSVLENETINESYDEFKGTENEPVLMPISELPLITENEDVVLQNEVQVVKEEQEGPPFKIEPSIPTNIPKYDFEELANSISKELEEIEKLSSKTIGREPVKEEPKVELERVHVEVTPIKEIQKRGGMPVFSSVFVPSANKEEVGKEDLPPNIENSEELKTNIEKVTETIFEEEPEVVEKEVTNKIDFSKLRSENINAVKPSVDLPKHIELPKKVEETQKEEMAIPDFSNIEGESYDIK